MTGSVPAGLEEAAAAFGGAQFGELHGDAVVRIDRSDLTGFMAAVLGAGFDMFVDLCAIDYLSRDPRFDVAVNVVSVARRQRLRVLLGVPGDDPVVPSITAVYPGANFYEREALDLFGIRFEGHPDPTRILLPDEWEGHPLRKDFPVGSVPVQFKGAKKAT